MRSAIGAGRGIVKTGGRKGCGIVNLGQFKEEPEAHSRDWAVDT